jgi:hypothetical protein
MMGGGASGKGHAVDQHYQGMKHIDPDAVKATEPMYTPKVDSEGKYGPSGPRNAEQYAEYPQDVREAQEAWIKANTPFSSPAEFAAEYLKTPGKFGGGLTHELSSYIGKSELEKSLEDHTKSFVFDSAGNKNYMANALRAKSLGYDVTFHHVYMPVEQAVKGNSLRTRSIPEDLLRATHARAAEVVPILRTFARDNNIRWRFTDNTDAKLSPS